MNDELAASPRPGPTHSGGRRLRDLSRNQRRGAVILGTVMGLPSLVAAGAARLDGWIPVGDEGVMAGAARQVFSATPPLTGEPTSAGKYGVTAFHPGPFPYELLAPFVWLLGAAVGMLLATALLSMVCMELIGYVSLRMHGPRAAVWAWATAAAMSLSLGGTAYLYRPFKSVAAVLPILLMLHVGAALLAGRLTFLPIWVFAGATCP